MKKEELIKKHLEGWNGLDNASIEHFAQSGKVSGSLFIALKSMMDEHTLSLSQQIEELREKNKRLREGLISIERICDNQNPSHESIWRIAYSLIGEELEMRKEGE